MPTIIIDPTGPVSNPDDDGFRHELPTVRQHPDALFSFGRCYVTPGVMNAISGKTAAWLLRAHELGIQGDLCDEDHALNQAALVNGSRILSSYAVHDFKVCQDFKVWIITEADRSATTILLPEEY